MSEICQLEIPFMSLAIYKANFYQMIFLFLMMHVRNVISFCLFYIWIAYLIGWVDLHISEPHERVWKRS